METPNTEPANDSSLASLHEQLLDFITPTPEGLSLVGKLFGTDTSMYLQYRELTDSEPMPSCDRLRRIQKLLGEYMSKLEQARL
jgi:hypothetical protein